jgi:hypothetical protein
MATKPPHGGDQGDHTATGAPAFGRVGEWMRKHLRGWSYPKPRHAQDADTDDDRRAVGFAHWLDQG